MLNRTLAAFVPAIALFSPSVAAALDFTESVQGFAATSTAIGPRSGAEYSHAHYSSAGRNPAGSGQASAPSGPTSSASVFPVDATAYTSSASFEAQDFGQGINLSGGELVFGSSNRLDLGAVHEGGFWMGMAAALGAVGAITNLSGSPHSVAGPVGSGTPRVVRAPEIDGAKLPIAFMLLGMLLLTRKRCAYLCWRFSSPIC